ncbi:Gag-pol fusion protein [Phytophthora megakarya]|uniref:Gag-pol fusion protein n=1 Tax=Phytophthora megakarya TaxID=4795 RepID=A0A225WVE4_9STRA|nr:Gag-pol fusion protein [Phytophthora megakarya]
MVVQIQVGKTRVTALLDTGCTSSAMDRATATIAKQDINLRPAVANFLNADGSPGTTTHNVEATFKMLDFSHSRTCSHEFRVADKLLYPVMLGRDFMQEQRMVLDFDRSVIEWGGMEIPMTKPSATKSFQAAVLASDTECRAEINMDEPEEVPLESMLSEAELTQSQETEVMNLVNEFSDLFTSSLGTMKKEPYVLPLTPDAKPIASRPFPIPRAYYDATRAEIQRLIDIGVLRNHYPTKDVKGMVRSVEQPKYKSVFDVPLSYYTRVLARKTRAATAITTPLGKFVFVRLPMGVWTAPDEFQACMDEKVGDLEYVRVYLNDIMITSSSVAEHLEHHAVVFHRLRDFGLTLHRKKSKICAEVVEYLGYQLTNDGIAALPNKVAAITAIVPPRNRREPTRTFQWTSTENEAFEAVKSALAKRVLLTFPASGRPFHVFTDASKLRLSAVITQDKKPLAYWSKKCNNAQTTYPANRLELLSISVLLREFRSMLLGQELHLHTDHLNLTYSTFHDVHMMRWRLEIEEFGPIFHYIPGSNNVVADALSRLPIADTDRSELEENAPPQTIGALAETAVSELRPVDMRVVAARQADDPTLGKTEAREIAGTVVKVHPVTKKVLVPKQLQQQLVETYHDLLIHL